MTRLVSRTTTSKPRARNERVSNTRVRKQQHLLDVKVRSHKATQYRNKRILVVTSKIVLSALVLAGIVCGIRYGSKRLFFENPEYRLTKIEVKTDGTLQRDVVLKTADLREGENIFSVNLARVHEALQQLPQVDDVQVVRNMPNEIDVQITERKPIAWITSDKDIGNVFSSDGGFLIDARGVLMREKKLLPEYLGLPVIAGCASESLEPGKVIDGYETKAALELLRLSTKSFMQTRFQIREIDLSKGYCLDVTDKNHMRVMLPFENLEKELARLEQFLTFADEAHREIATMNLLVQRNVPVTYAPTPTEVINDTFDEADDAKIPKAMPVDPALKPKAAAAPNEKPRKATPVEKRKKG
jgi:cell division septal protein FtsQ